VGRAIFMGKAGTIAKINVGNIKEISDFRMYDFAPSALSRLSAAGYYICIVSNERNGNQGAVYPIMTERVEEYIRHTAFAQMAFEYCFDKASDKDNRRLPKPDMILHLMAKKGFRPSECAMIVSSDVEYQAAVSAGIDKIITVKTGKKFRGEKDVEPIYEAAGLSDVAQFIESGGLDGAISDRSPC
jgi:histidinol phosphatase-like enzyme